MFKFVNFSQILVNFGSSLRPLFVNGKKNKTHRVLTFLFATDGS